MAITVCGIGEKLYVWHVSSGRLMAVLSKNFQRITCVKFTDDASHFVTAAEDGLVMVWPLGRVVAMTQDLFRGVSDLTEPRYSYNDHSLPVTDMYVGKGGIRARLLTVSLDGTTKMYDLASGAMLLSLVFGDALTSVTLCNAETYVFVGATNGKIFQYFLHHPPRSVDYHVPENEKDNIFSEHSKAITSLSVSIDGVLLMSGSLDEQVIIWDVSSMQCLRKLQHKGPVTNAFFSLVPSNIFSNDLKPSMVISSFKKESSVTVEEKFNVHMLNSENVLPMSKFIEARNSSNCVGIAVPTMGVSKGKEDVQRLKKVNKQLYGFIIKNLLKSEVRTCPPDVDDEISELTGSTKKKIKTGHSRGFIVTDIK